jgi:hypothetical protein
MVQKVYINWEDLNLNWEDINMTWEEIAILTEIQNRGGSSQYYNGNPWKVAKEQLGEEKAVKFIKLICRINNLEYEKVFDIKTEETKITIGHIEKVFNEGMKIGIKIL